MAVVQLGRTAGTDRFDAALEKMRDGVQAMAAWIRTAEGETLGQGLIQIRESGIDPLEAVFAGGDLGYEHVALMARTADHIGAAAVRQNEANFLRAAQTMDPGQFTSVTKNFEHRVDPEGALNEANRAHARRYLHLSEPQNGMMRIDGLLDAEGGATVRSALQAFMKPMKDDERSYGQRQHDALIELCRQRGGGKRDGAGPRPQLIIRASLETLAGIPGAPA